MKASANAVVLNLRLLSALPAARSQMENPVQPRRHAVIHRRAVSPSTRRLAVKPIRQRRGRPVAASPDRQAVGVDVNEAWSRFKNRLHAFALRRVGAPDEADDVVQAVLVRLLQHQDRIESDRLAAWLFRTARNAVIDRRRRSGREAVAAEEAALHAAAEVPDDAVPELAACVQPLLGMLSEEDRIVLEDVELNGRSQTDLARTLGVSPSTVKSRVQRARRRLREQVERCCAIELDSRGLPRDFTPRGQPNYASCDGCT